MATSKEYKDFVLEQLSGMDGITCKPMMGEYLLYLDGVLFGGIYDDRLLVKKTVNNVVFGMEEDLPYDGAKPMFSVSDTDEPEKLKKIISTTYKDLLKIKRR